MKIEYAEPGTDPTQIPSTRARMGAAAFFQDNWMLVIGVVFFAFLGATKFLDNGDSTSPAVAPTAAPTAVVVQRAPEEGFPGWCELNGTLIPPGEHQIGNEIRRCLEGLWFADAPDTP